MLSQLRCCGICSRQYDDARADSDAAVKVLNVLVGQTNATGGHEGADGRWLIGAVDTVFRVAVQALVVSTVVVVLDELVDAMFELTWQIVVFQQDLVFHRAVISLDLTLRHRVVRPAADMADAVILEPVAKLARDVGWTIIAQQPWSMQDLDLVQT